MLTLLVDQFGAHRQPKAPSSSNPFGIKDHVAVDLLVELRHIVAVNELERRNDVLHLLLNCLPPKVSPLLFIDLEAFCHRLW